jgi:hypothetical protein
MISGTRMRTLQVLLPEAAIFIPISTHSTHPSDDCRQGEEDDALRVEHLPYWDPHRRTHVHRNNWSQTIWKIQL